VPLIVVSENSKQFGLRSGGSLRDISPTMLGMLAINEPREMTGKDLRVPLADVPLADVPLSDKPA
jgi:2,3-bisphosphoglycerate-independent phosphoglycerate mutase